jgi:hypothetical protein
MTTPSEQWIVGVLREATDRMPLPPESRWIRERRSTPSVSMILLVGVAAILIIAVGMTIGALRVEPRLVPAAEGVGPSTFAEAEDREWRITRFAVTSDLVVLRPTWVPAEYRGSVECPSPWSLIGTGATSSRTDFSSYSVEYRGRVQPPGRCTLLQFYGELGTQDDSEHLPEGQVETGTFDARGTTVHVVSGVLRPSTDAPPPLTPIHLRHLWWNESGAHYDVIAFSNDDDIALADLVRVIGGLEPMR